MAGRYGPAAANDIVPNGGIFPLDDLALPGSINLSAFASAGSPTILNVIVSGTWQAATSALPTKGVNHAAETEIYLPVNGAVMLYLNGSGTARITMYTAKNNEN